MNNVDDEIFENGFLLLCVDLGRFLPASSSWNLWFNWHMNIIDDENWESNIQMKSFIVVTGSFFLLYSIHSAFSGTVSSMRVVFISPLNCKCISNKYIKLNDHEVVLKMSGFLRSHLKIILMEVCHSLRLTLSPSRIIIHADECWWMSWMEF